MDHGVFEAEQPHPTAQEALVGHPAEPVGDDVVAEVGDDEAHVDASLGGLDEATDEGVVGDEVGGRQPDPGVGAVDRLEVHVADRVDHVGRQVAVDPHLAAPRAPRRLGERWRAAVVVPVVDEGVFELDDHVPGEACVGVAPAVGVVLADVVAADVGGGAVDDEQLAVVAPPVAGEEELRASGHERVALDVDALRQAAVELLRHDEVGEGVEDDVDLDAALVGVDEGLAEAPTDGIGLPDVGLEVDPRGRGLDVGEHVLEEVLAEGVDPYVAAVDRHRGAGAVRELLVRAVLATQRVEDEQAADRGQLGRERRCGGTPHESAHLAAPAATAGGAQIHDPSLGGRRRGSAGGRPGPRGGVRLATRRGRALT